MRSIIKSKYILFKRHLQLFLNNIEFALLVQLLLKYRYLYYMFDNCYGLIYNLYIYDKTCPG